jgi:hypothetical protein
LFHVQEWCAKVLAEITSNNCSPQISAMLAEQNYTWLALASYCFSWIDGTVVCRYIPAVAFPGPKALRPEHWLGVAMLQPLDGRAVDGMFGSCSQAETPLIHE